MPTKKSMERGPIQLKSQNLQNEFFRLGHSLKSTLQFGIRKNVICERKVCLPAADAFAFSRPDGRLGDLSHTIKA